MIPDRLLDDLTDPQRQAVTHTDGPLLVLAGAGSGKTRVITRRAGWLARTVARPDQVLAITFTNKAAGEMRERVWQLGVGRGTLVCTFHSLCARLLRDYAGRVGLRPNFSIYDQADRVAVIREAVEAANLSTDNWRPKTVEWRISRAKNGMVSAAEFSEMGGDFQVRQIAEIWTAYEQMMRDRNAVDFDDLLVFTARLLGEHADVRDALEDRFPYLLIDEYQDTNHPQYLIATRFARRRRNICATGDPDQSIYGWRGADIRNILDFERQYPDAKVVRLEENYRSTPAILSAAGRLIERNKRRKEKGLWTNNPPGPPVSVWHCEDEHDEAQRIAEDVIKFRAEGGNAGDVALFYRISALTRVLEDALRRAKIPYQIARGVEFYARREIKDVLAYLRIVANPQDDTAFKRALNTPPRGIGKTTLDRLIEHAQRTRAAEGRPISLSEALAQVESIPSVKSAREKLKRFGALLETIRAQPARPVTALLEFVLKHSGLQAALEADPDPEKEALANVMELVSAAAEYDAENPDGSVPDWLEQVALVSDTDRLSEAGGAVTLMTLHAAKGLEFPRVYIVGLEEDLLPHHRALTDPEGDLEEERRLCFVGMTRAKQRLVMTYVDYRTVRGMAQRTMSSRFLRELPQEEIEHVEAGSDAGKVDGYERGAGGDFNYDDFDPEDWRPGKPVSHPQYGRGEVVRLEPRGRAAWVRVRFPDVGEKSFALDHAPLRLE